MEKGLGAKGGDVVAVTSASMPDNDDHNDHDTSNMSDCTALVPRRWMEAGASATTATVAATTTVPDCSRRSRTSFGIV
jgi:hypothetical protein